ncbi:ChbG/HpnK family deacetylase [Rhodomicrobium vannielii ATCC 17100]|uniref:ChbG/HpnK family deacetylase n=1 Tax=Rhodomicrobium udaipurense TaxID=1202716 RepID=A0A8I1KIX0_9HYPH|nr:MULTISPECIES: ChbG/HpnK family deacetylase [Rhodomicrobium]KAI93936.1 hypothetical protein T281_13725 [Rhodomicrobium udaipurense JA643]MBJ7532759.1 ChbG/HpnK family deacetylase [Rhodomicrobium vannielii ATCC 17100]MBJ7545140.1 ChbG/HpnK family deacetylase [Rhodomicrobium udaipurense]
MKNIIINADDYALDDRVDAAILELADKGVVTAASAMVLSPRWMVAARSLRTAPLSRGLHLDLTSPFAEGKRANHRLSALIALSHARRLDLKLVRQAIAKQLLIYEEGMGAAPHFVDGHQHVHHLPGVAEVLVDVLSDRYAGNARLVGLRICTPKIKRGTKATVIARTGAERLSKLAEEHGHITNTDFAGVYDFSEKASLPQLWQGWLDSAAGAWPLIMCHVAKPGGGDADSDPIRAARIREYDWLRSPAFAALNQRASAQPAGWPQA